MTNETKHKIEVERRLRKLMPTPNGEGTEIMEDYIRASGNTLEELHSALDRFIGAVPSLGESKATKKKKAVKRAKKGTK